MAVDLADLVEFVRAEVDAPGEDSFPEATDADWTLQLQSSYWELVLDGILGVGDYTEVDGVLTPSTATADLPRDIQQLVVFYAGIRVIRNKLRTMGTLFRAKAGPVEYETQNSANVLKSILDELVRKRNLVLNRLSDLGAVDSVYVDMVQYRDASMGEGSMWWVKY